MEAPFNKRDYERYGIALLISNGFDVEVWDFTGFLTNSKYREITVPDPIQWDGHIVFKDKKSALRAIRNMPAPVYVISMLHYNFNTLGIYRLLSRRSIFYCLQTFALPISENTAGQRFIQKLKRFNFERVWRHLFQAFPLCFFGVRPANLNLAMANKYLKDGLPIGKGTEVLWCHSFDYDIYKKQQALPIPSGKRIGVFLDEYLPFHPDFARIGWEPPVTARKYYESLCNFFSYIESSLNLDIVIAAHPRSHYNEKDNFFKGRKVIRGRTAELVRQSEFVILHHSIAINFAVLFRKPLIFIYTDEIAHSLKKGRFEDPSILWLASFFGKKAYNIDSFENIDFSREFLVDKLAYRRYKDFYIKNSISEDLPLWQIFANRIKKQENNAVC